MSAGYLAIVLHAHLPYVHHPSEENVLEERWLFEALNECYLPLLEVMENLYRDGINYQITISMSSPLVSMLDSPILQERYLQFLDNLIALAEKEIERTKGDRQFAHLAEMYRDKFQALRHRFVHLYRKNLILPFRQLMEQGCLEIITCAGTHGYLPLILTDEAVRAQVGAAVDQHKHFFGRPPKGMWLPECGYRPGLDLILKEFGLQYFLVDSHGIDQGIPKPPDGVYNPVSTVNGLGVFGRDPESAHQVWSSFAGYPGDYDYREYYRDIGWDLPWEYLKPHMHPDGFRHNTGIKYHRITGPGEHREPYNPIWAAEKAALQAGHFVDSRVRQVGHLRSRTKQPPIVVCPYDAELFGHWWYEGPSWLDYVIRKTACDQQAYRLITPGNYLATHGRGPRTGLSLSSWGEDGYSKVWLNPSNDWMYRHLHKAEARMEELVTIYPSPSPLEDRALKQAGRELLLAQSSDWAFIMKTGTTVEYAERRFKEHIARFTYLYNRLKSHDLPEEALGVMEGRDAIFPHLNYKLWQKAGSFMPVSSKAPGKRRILMLSWEFPPKTIGGLARHVYDLSRALVQLGEEVHVLTSSSPGCPSREVVDGVVVHRLNTMGDEGKDFLQWIFYLNGAMLNYAHTLFTLEGPFQIIHAHDWLVAYAAEALKKKYSVPLIATIHATEHGRNRGIHNLLQGKIHGVEWRLTYEAWRVIGCSKYMFEEIAGVFRLPPDKLEVIPNGVDVSSVRPKTIEPLLRQKYVDPAEKLIIYIGRLVTEKGVQVLIDSLSAIRQAYPGFKCLIAGRGPMGDELRRQVAYLGLESQVVFLGFVDDDTRNQLLAVSDVAVFPSLYEPFGIVALEAMAARIPVVVSDTGGLGEIITNGVNGLKVPPGDGGALAGAILELFTNPELAADLTEKAWEEVNTVYHWDVLAKQTRAVYERVQREAATGSTVLLAQ